MEESTYKVNIESQIAKEEAIAAILGELDHY
jgi:hypothetical protein